VQKNKIISLLLIIIGLLLSITGIILYTTKAEKVSENKTNEENKKTPEEITASWIGEYESEKENRYYLLFDKYNSAQIMVIKDGHDSIYTISDISYEKINIKSENMQGVLKRNSDSFELSLKINGESEEKVLEEKFKKIDNSLWNGLYKKNDTSIFITKITESFLYISFYDEKKDTSISKLMYYDSSNSENLVGNFISDEKIIYKKDDGDLFTILKNGKNIKVEYSGNNKDYSLFNGKFDKYEF